MKAAATDLGLAVSHRVADVVEANVELGVVVAFGRLIKPNVLEKVPMINVHFSLLPRWRGAAPVERAILAGDDVTGVGIMQLEEGLDTGPVYVEETVDIRPDETADELRTRLVDVGTRLLVDVLAQPLPAPRAQDGEPTYAAKIDPAELEIDWTKDAADIARLVRIGRAWTTFRGKRLQVVRAKVGDLDAHNAPPGHVLGLAVACGGGTTLELVEVKPEGKGVQPASAWINGARPHDERLGE